MPLRNDVVGKLYPPQCFDVTREASIAYAKAYNETHSILLSGEVVPPMFGVVYAWTALAQSFFDAETGIQPEDIMRLVHGEEDLYFLKAVRPGEAIQTTAFIKEITSRCNGESMVVGLSSKNPSGETVQLAWASLFFRKKGEEPFSPLKAELPNGKLILEKTQTTDPDQAQRYAQASGDHNPIHTDETTARLAGLPGPILHGLCSMAFISSLFLNELCHGDPNRLKRLKTRFAKPAFPGETLSTRIYELRKNSRDYMEYAFETSRSDGQVALKHGIAWIMT